ncbi:hypothetical protein QTP88_000238 [Uroleucon formosanum]
MFPDSTNQSYCALKLSTIVFVQFIQRFPAFQIGKISHSFNFFFNMSDEDKIIASVAFVFTSLVSQVKKKSFHKRCCWQRTIFESRCRYNGNNLLNDLRLEHPGFKNFIRMSPIEFESLLEVISPQIGKDITRHFKLINLK